MPSAICMSAACLQGYWYSPGWQKYRQALIAKPKTPLVPGLVPGSATTARGVPDTTITAITTATATATTDSTDMAATNGPDALKPCDSAAAAGSSVSAATSSAVPVVLAYATVSHTTGRYAEAITKVLQGSGSIKVRILALGL
jgi:cell wall-associated NlpC family hydrolase